MTTDVMDAQAGPRLALWSYPFRPFFIATAAYAILALAGWLGILLLGWPLSGAHSPMQWHSHEILFGVVTAAIAGFLLTAMCNWTGAKPVSGRALQTLFALWLAGRAAMWLSAVLPHWLVALVDLAFLALVALHAAFAIIGSGNSRNLPLVVVVTVLWLANGLFHAGLMHADPELVRSAELATIGLITLLITIIGGRITPAFSRNWMMRVGLDPTGVRTRKSVEYTTITSTLALVVFLLAGAPAWLIAPTAGLAGVAQLARLIGWAGWRTRRDPLVWILHLGYAWIPLGLLLMALDFGFGLVPTTAWLHALGPGAMGVMIVGVMTRVALGHTGRPLALPRLAVAAYWLIIAAAVLRLLTALGWFPWGIGVKASALAWVGAFAVFLVLYLPILLRPRPDGRPG